MRLAGRAAARLLPVWCAAVGLAATGLSWNAAAWAQNAPIQSTELPPLQEQSRPNGLPSGPAAPVPYGAQGVPGGLRPGAQGQFVPGQGMQGQGPQGQVFPGQGVQGQGPQGQAFPGQGVQGQVVPGQGVQDQGTQGAGIPAPTTPGLTVPGQGAQAPDAQTPGGQGPGGQGPGGQGPGGQATQAVPPVTAPATFDRPNVWMPATVVKLQALDKVNAQASELTIKVGQAATFGSLTITAKSCVVRPPDQPADAAAYLDVTDSHKDAPGFDGWMLADEPAVSMMQHPIYDLRVTGCS
jgi:hypothetical protein